MDQETVKTTEETTRLEKKHVTSAVRAITKNAKLNPTAVRAAVSPGVTHVTSAKELISKTPFSVQTRRNVCICKEIKNDMIVCAALLLVLLVSALRN